ncbi:MAG: hypothetical protein C0490_20480, partial [Marivirga sp.]|nr:hypothetical protein [Marivirga sp.]
MEMFEDIVKYLEEKEKLGRATVHNLRQIASYYSKITNETQEKLINIKRKYNFNNRKHIFPDQTSDTHLEFWRGSCEYNVAVSLADNTGVYDIDKELGIIVPEWTYENFLTNDDEIEQQKYFKIADNLFYSWMGFNWQIVGGYETRLSV